MKWKKYYQTNTEVCKVCDCHCSSLVRLEEGGGERECHNSAALRSDHLVLLFLLKISKLHTLYSCIVFVDLPISMQPFLHFFPFCCWHQVASRLGCCYSRPLILTETVAPLYRTSRWISLFFFFFIKHPDALGGSHLQGSAAVRRERCKEARQQASTQLWSSAWFCWLTGPCLKSEARVAACPAHSVPPFPLCERARRGHWAQLIFSLSRP